MVEAKKGGAAEMKQAEECIAKAEKELKTGLFKWKPDYVQAAIQYEKAAKIYKKIG